MIDVTIIGATSHVAMGLIYNFLNKTDYRLYLYARNIGKLKEFLEKNKLDSVRCSLSDNCSMAHQSKTVINCIGSRYNQNFINNVSDVFILTETFDNIILNNLKSFPDTTYINFSSGAVYRDFSNPATYESVSPVPVNTLNSGDYYSIAKINSEAKHRCLSSYNIFDIRIFAYFSRFIELDSSYFITEIIRSILENNVFYTNSTNIERDYCGHEEIYQIVQKCIEKKVMNAALDLYSAGTASKFEIISYFEKDFGLKYEIDNSLVVESMTNTKSQYFSINHRAEYIGYKPLFNSIEIIGKTAEEILGKH